MDKQFQDKLYMEICSEKTLQTNQAGFFMTFVESVQENVGLNWIKNVFGKLKTDKERIRIIYENNKCFEVISQVFSNVQELYRKKNAEISRNKRLEGEQALKSNHDKLKSLLLFSQSILRAPEKGQVQDIDEGLSLALALWQRSNVLMQLKEYKFALADLQLCLKDLPNNHKGEIFWRMAICYKQINENQRAKISFDLAEKFIKSPEKLKLLQKDRETETNTTEQKEKVSTNNSSKFASDKISIKETKNLGRFAVANQTIKTGETLVVEAPYVACLLPEAFGTHCHHCFNRLVAPIGCPNCSNIAFCTENCRNVALKTYHRFECKYLDLLIGSGMSILSHCALRMITQNTIETNLEIYNNHTKNENIFKLCTNSKLRKSEDFFQRTLMAAFLLRFLQKSNYFYNKNNNAKNIIPTDDNEYKIAEMILFNLQILQFNAHEIYETLYCNNSNENRFKYSKTKYIGVGLYPTVALFNHDCSLTVTRHFIGKNIAINSCRLIEKNQAISENYGPIFARKNLNDRQRSLYARYWFNCQCTACTQNWPNFLDSGLDKIEKYVRCPTLNCTNSFTVTKNTTKVCPKCNEKIDLTQNIERLNWCENQYDLAFNLMNLSKVNEAIKVLCKALDEFYKISLDPHKGTHLAQEMLRVCYADSGNFHECLIKSTKYETS